MTTLATPTPVVRSSLTSRERVARMFARQDHDRIPRHDTYWGETIDRWKGEGMIGHPLDHLHTDFCSLQWLWPQCFPGEDKVVDEDDETRVVRDGQGKTVRYWKHRMGTPEHLNFDCDSRQKWEMIYKPALLASGLQNDPAAVVRAYRRGRDLGRWCHLTGVEPFEETRSLMGDELTAIAMAEDPQWVRDVAETFTDQVLMNFDAIMGTGIQPDGLWIYGDMAYNHATFCSPAMYRELIWPEHKRLADWAHAHRMKFIYHTDGDINGVIDLYLDAGFDCIQPLEAKAQMDVRTLAPQVGDRLALFGNIDVMVMGTNDFDAIDHEMSTKLAAGMATRGYCYHSDHSVPPMVSWDTYRHVIACIERWGNYT
jgi:uroporphyrinogen decarboxylase